MIVTLEEFKASLDQAELPPGLAATLDALWQDGKGDWDAAHKIVQAEHGADAEWVHAYLHRKEGDLSNAGYWYRRCNRPVSALSLEAEWAEIAAALLAGSKSG